VRTGAISRRRGSTGLLRRGEGAVVPHVEMTREFPMDRKLMFDHLTDPTTWPTYYNNIIEVKPFDRFTEVGDQLTARYRLLGRAVDLDVELLELNPPDRIRLLAKAPGLPPLEQDWIYEDADGGTRIHARVETPEVDSWLGRALDRYVVPRQLERDLARSLDNIAELVAVGWA
jgi:hypothetical protein